MNQFKGFRDWINEDNKAEPWDDVHKRLVDARFVSCVEDYELRYIIADLKTKYKGSHSAEQIANAVMECCKERGKKIGREFFLNCVLTKLGEKK